MIKKKKYTIAYILGNMLRDSFRQMPVRFTFCLFIIAAAGAGHGVITLANKYFFESVELAVAGAGVNVIMPLLLLGAAAMGSQLLDSLEWYMASVVEKKTILFRTKAMNIKAASISAVEFENPELFDMMNKAKEGLKNSFDFEFSFILLMLYYPAYFGFMSVLLFSINPYLILVIALVFLPVVVSQILRIKMYRKLEKDIAPVRRKYEYYEKCMKDREFFKETRILGAFKYHKRVYTDTLAVLNKKQWKADKRTGLMELYMKIITLAGYYGVLVLLIILLINGGISAGVFVAVFHSMGSLFFFMERMLYSQIGDASKKLGSVENYFEFMDLPEREGTADKIKRYADIELENVSFSYPKSGVESLTDINLSIKAGSTIAIVGENGAGKSTLIRLISGIYLPTKGSVKYGKTDTANMNPKALFEKISAVFQKYQKYQLSLADNIVISDSRKSHEESVLKASAEKAGVDYQSRTYIDGFDTMLSREFDGVDLSGGQWQRVAIARGYYKDHEVIILDEPTAAIDPIEESRIYEQFAKISSGKTSFIVTHRLGSAKIADRIIVLKNGRVVEDGTHETLINKDGEYAHMYASQAKWYS